MDASEFKSIVEGAISELICSEPFFDVATRNWTANQGNEEELYPYLTEMIRRRLAIGIQGIGWGKYHSKGEKSDCLCYFNIANRKAIFSVELKGPSKDNAWVSNGLNEDIDKLKRLKTEGIIDYGIAVGVWLIDKEKCNEEFERTLTINSSQIRVKVCVLDTQGASSNS